MNMRSLTVLLLFIAVALLTNHFASAEDRESSSDVSVYDFREKFPDAVEDGECYLLKLDGCRVVAVSTPYASGRIELMFVNAKKKSDAQKVAKELAKELSSKCRVVPFEGSAPWVAIICPTENYSRRYSTSLILYPDGGRNVRFVGWQGKLLRVQMDYSNYSTSTHSERDAFVPSYRKKGRGVIEILLDVTSSSLSHVECRIAKGRLDGEHIADFLDNRLLNSSSYLPEFSSREKSELRSKFPGCDLIAYSTSADFCIANKKGKTYHVGTIDGVSAYLCSKHPIAKFNFPEENMDWPGKRIAQNETSTDSDHDTAMGSTSERTSSHDNGAEATALGKTTPSPAGDNTAMEAAATATMESIYNSLGEVSKDTRLNVDSEIARYIQMLQSL